MHRAQMHMLFLSWAGVCAGRKFESIKMDMFDYETFNQMKKMTALKTL